MRFRRSSEEPLKVAVTVERDIPFDQVMPAILSAGLQEPMPFEEFGVVYGEVLGSKVMKDIKHVSGVLAVEQQVIFRPAP